jgi:long-chain acyl-CoA synthetase
VVPNYDAFIRLFDEKGITYDKSKLVFSEADGARICTQVGQDFVDKPELKNVIDADIRKVNTELEEYECIKKYAILKRKLTVEEGEMTPTLKVKRNEVIKHFKAEIEGLYD